MRVLPFINVLRRSLRRAASSSALPLLVGIALAISAPVASAASEGVTYDACPTCSPRDMVWSEGEFDKVYLSANTATANLQPQRLPVDLVSRGLLALKIERNGSAVALFDDDSATTLARGLAAALAKATAQQDVLFFVVSQGNSGLLGAKLGNSGRAFLDKDGLNIVMGETHVDFVGRYRATRLPRTFRFASRSAASAVVLAADGMRHPRSDWAVLPVAAGTVLAPALPAPLMAAPATRDDRYYAAQEERLKSLKRLRTQDLITEQEYQAKRADILKEW
ncbi:hypothetical protein [Actimicrobium antarcticum]|uniref:SHOCT domain-containing protein n=1 Tax=Actimicrobium antarcticum TaxID=1051899 RepID=A0ABP7TYT6_9BURK